MPVAPSRPKPPAAPPPPSQQRKLPTTTGPLSAVRGGVQCGKKIGIYGAGGIGKSKLWTLAEQVGILPIGIDIENSCSYLDAPLVQPTPMNWDQLRDVLKDLDFLSQYGIVAIDSFTKAEEMATEWTVKNVPDPKTRKAVPTVSDYSYGVGGMQVYTTFLNLLGDLDAVTRQGIHVVYTAHDCVSEVPNPNGENFIHYEPRLQSPKSGFGSIRHRVKEWSDHLIFIGYDIRVSEDGKATGSGTRTIYPVERPMHWAKSRLLSQSFEYKDNDPTLWNLLFNKETT